MAQTLLSEGLGARRDPLRELRQELLEQPAAEMRET